MGLRFPLDLGHKADTNYPYMSFNIFKFQDRNFIVDGKPQTKYNTGVGLVDATTDAIASGILEVRQGLTKDSTVPVMQDFIHLPLPDNVNMSVNPSWEMTDMRVINSIRDAMASSGVSEALGIAGNTAASLFLGDTAKKLTRKTPNPKKQALFNGIEPRNFTWSWTLIPYSKQEAETIDKIVKLFTEYSLPILESDADAFYDFPAEFGITFNNVKGFPVLSFCVCTNVNVSYSQQNTQIMEDGYPAQTTLTLSFLETDLRTKNRPGI